VRTIVRRIGNSLGVLLPKAVLDGWGGGEGDHLEVSEFGVRPPRRRGSSQKLLDERKRQLAAGSVDRGTIETNLRPCHLAPGEFFAVAGIQLGRCDHNSNAGDRVVDVIT
jgi:antitoxin component of MazEF toxin-antitoxin module